MKIFLAGEGKAELGAWAHHPSYRNDPPEPGLLEVLLRRVRRDGWTIGDAVCWKNIPKYRAHDRLPAEVANVLGLVLRARQAGCSVVAFSRDRDGDRRRDRDVQAGIERAREIVPDCPAIVGGMAVEAIESWVASLHGKRGAESSSNPSALLENLDLAHMRTIAECADLSQVPSDATSLLFWLGKAAEVLGIQGDDSECSS